MTIRLFSLALAMFFGGNALTVRLVVADNHRGSRKGDSCHSHFPGSP